MMGWEEKAVSLGEISSNPLEGSFQFASALTPQRCALNLMLISTWEPMPCLFAHCCEKGEKTQWRKKRKEVERERKREEERERERERKKEKEKERGRKRHKNPVK